MRPKDIREIYAEEQPATLEEARRIAHEARENPDQARRLLVTLYSLAGADANFDMLLQLILKVGTMQLLLQEAKESDTFALHMADLILSGMEQIIPIGSQEKPQRGRQNAKKASSA